MRLASFVLIAFLVSSGCATLFSGTEDDITFRSEPSGAEVIIDGITVGTTPLTVEVDRPGFEDTDVTIELDGYDSRTFELDKEFNNTAILNIFIWPGFVVDALTGALYKYDKKLYNIDLSDGSISLNLDDLPRSLKGRHLMQRTEAAVMAATEK